MFRTTSTRALRVCVLGLATLTTAVIFTTDSADARRYRHRHHARHHEARESYNPAFSSIIVDGNSGTTLSANNPDASRHPASLTKVMTLYLLFERLDAGKMTLGTEMEVSAHASEQAPTKLGLRPGQTIRVEDAIKGLVTRSANDAAVVIAEAIAGDEGDFAKAMTRKARALGMTRTVYRNASGLPDDNQVTTARDQSTLGRAIQDRFPRYYRYFSTVAFNYRGHSIRNHNRLLGNVEGVDGIKTGYTRASGFNLVTSMRRGNRHLVGVVMGGRSGGSRDATMRSLLTENLEKAATKRTVAAIAERNASDAHIKPVKVKTVQVKAGQMKLASAGSAQPATAITNAISPARPEVPETSSAVVAKAETNKAETNRAETNRAETNRVEVARTEMPPQPANHGTGNGLLGVLPASSVPPSPIPQAMAYADPAPRAQPQIIQQNGAIKPAAAHTGWIVQVGALES